MEMVRTTIVAEIVRVCSQRDSTKRVGRGPNSGLFPGAHFGKILADYLTQTVQRQIALTCE
jgi:hypothetical protein